MHRGLAPGNVLHSLRCALQHCTIGNGFPLQRKKLREMMVSLLGVFSKHVLNHEKGKKKRHSRETPGNVKRTPAESVKLAADLNRIVLRLYGQFLSEVRCIIS